MVVARFVVGSSGGTGGCGPVPVAARTHPPTGGGAALAAGVVLVAAAVAAAGAVGVADAASKLSAERDAVPPAVASFFPKGSLLSRGRGEEEHGCEERCKARDTHACHKQAPHRTTPTAAPTLTPVDRVVPVVVRRRRRRKRRGRCRAATVACGTSPVVGTLHVSGFLPPPVRHTTFPPPTHAPCLFDYFTWLAGSPSNLTSMKYRYCS
eukprot:Rhum_TRINITY_DN14467_c21_g1::Rhum_TRINITY_DN14467_c21_g1_i1::g.91825::m.91825